jgi:predicted DNA-binding transcriptional regulator
LSRDQWYGALILVAGIVGIVIYVWGLFTFALIVLQLTALVAVGGVLVIVAWIGYTMATTPPPAPLDLETPGTSASVTEPSQASESESK